MKKKFSNPKHCTIVHPSGLGKNYNRAYRKGNRKYSIQCV